MFYLMSFSFPFNLKVHTIKRCQTGLGQTQEFLHLRHLRNLIFAKPRLGGSFRQTYSEAQQDMID